MAKYVVKPVMGRKFFYADSLVDARKLAINYGFKNKYETCEIYQTIPMKFLGIVYRADWSKDINSKQYLWRPYNQRTRDYDSIRKLYLSGKLKKTKPSWPYRLK